MQRVIQNVGVVFKGSGWYITDSRNSTKSNGAGGSTASAESPTTDLTETRPAAADAKATDEKSPVRSEKAKPAAAAAS